jgi:HD-like signal output (HDOD) protein
MSDFHTELRAFSADIEQELRRSELSFPAVLDLSLRIRQLADDPSSSTNQIAALVRIEPVLSARIIRLANSVIFNVLGRNISSVSEAIQRVGMSNVRVTALVVAMDQLAQEHRSKAMRALAKDVWRHSVDVAAWAYAISRYLRIGAPETALLAGMMIDIGQLFLIARVGRYPAVAADIRGFSEMAEFWSPAVTRAVLESM